MASNRRATEKLLQTLLPERTSAPEPAVLDLGECRCGGSGILIEEDSKGNRLVRDCSCRISKRIAARLRKAGLPDRFQDATLDSYDALGKNASLGRGLAAARRFVQEYPVGTAGRGLLLVGTVGVGKTHLAVGVLRTLVLERGASGMFCDFRDLLNRIKATFNGGDESEAEIFREIFAVDVLVLDELGAARVTDWTFDAVENIINGRYNRSKTTLITTNLANLPPGGSASSADAGDVYAAAARSAVRADTLGDRIGARMHSRLQEMCQVVEMNGEDYRSRGKR